jgi:CxxC motif-containing protein (DUF1111 family)
MKYRLLPGSLGRWLILLSLSLVFILGLTLLQRSQQKTVRAAEGAPQGTPIANLSNLETTLFDSGYTVFNKTWSLSGGLGPVFTQADCSTCHANPVAGGGSPTTILRKDVLFATTNGDGSFNNMASQGGPLQQQQSVSEFKPNCKLAGEMVPSNATLRDSRLAPAAMGMGLIDSIPDAAIIAQAQLEQTNMADGIAGQANLQPDENGSIRPGRFGYKAEAVDLVQFVSAAMVGELSVTNEIFPNEPLPQGQPIPTGCEIAPEPNDTGANMVAMYHYLLYLAPNPFPQNVDSNGETQFSMVGCSLCHLPSYTTGPKVEVWETWPEGSEVIFSKALSNQPAMLYSDLLLHNMGNLGDGFPSLDGNGNPTGVATGNQFRTTPLWGLSLRSIYLHDGRAKTLADAIADHDLGTGSEAHQVILNYDALSSQDQADLLTFIGSL